MTENAQPTTADDLVDTLADADDLRAKALKIVASAPYWQYVYDEGEWAQLYIAEGDVAVLRWPHCASDYDSCSMETEVCEFPAALLLLSDAELSIWQKEQDAAHKARAKKQAEAGVAARKKQEVEQERHEYERLKAKFEKRGDEK
jgi:hypothetical protein